MMTSKTSRIAPGGKPGVPGSSLRKGHYAGFVTCVSWLQHPFSSGNVANIGNILNIPKRENLKRDESV